MRLASRKMTFQLTPLLDLLLIVIFAQYMDVRETQSSTRSAFDQQLAAARAEASESAADARRVRNALDDLELRAEDQLTQLEDALETAVKQQEEIGDVLTELFQVPDELVDEVLAARQASRQPLSAAELKRLRQQIAEITRKRGREIVKHLITYDELLKRCDVWEIYVKTNGVVVLTAGDESFEFRVQNQQDFIRKVDSRVRSLPEPKGLVIILFSHGDARLGVLDSILNGLPNLTDRLQQASNGRTRYEYAVLGFSPEGPSLRSTAPDDQPE